MWIFLNRQEFQGIEENYKNIYNIFILAYSIFLRKQLVTIWPWVRTGRLWA